MKILNHYYESDNTFRNTTLLTFGVEEGETKKKKKQRVRNEQERIGAYSTIPRR